MIDMNLFTKLNLIKKFKTPAFLDGNFLFKSKIFKKLHNKHFRKNKYKWFYIRFKSKISKLGFYNNYNMIIKNINSDASNSDDYKENENFYLSGIFQYNSSFPLAKETSNSLSIFKPKMSIKLSPKHTKDQSDKKKWLDVDNIFNINRLSSDNSIEGGASLAFGGDYKIFDEKKSREVFEIKLQIILDLKKTTIFKK